jgi:hypothetical protein
MARTIVQVAGNDSELTGKGDYSIFRDGRVSVSPESKMDNTGSGLVFGRLDVPLASQSEETLAAKAAFIAAIEADYAAYHALVKENKAVNSSDPARRI